MRKKRHWFVMFLTVVMFSSGLTVPGRRVTATEETEYAVQIGKTSYENFQDAIEAANASAEDVTIELLADIQLNQFVSIKNTSGKAIVIDGKGHIVTTNVTNAFRIQYKGNVTFKNLNILHTAQQATIRLEAAATVSIKDVTINATNNKYLYGLINILNSMEATEKAVLNLTNVKAAMSVTTGNTNVSDHAIIRTGNADETKTVEINLKNCNLSTEGSSHVRGILIMKNTMATVNITDSTIASKDVYPIQDLSGKAVVNKTREVLTMADYVAQMDGTLYKSFETALNAANVAAKAVTMELLSDIEIASQNVYIGNANGAIIVDGNGHTLTTAGGKDSGKDNNAFRINKASVVEFRNMSIVHKHRGSIIQTDAANSTLNLSDVTINATNPDNSAGNYNYTLINLTVDSTLNLTRVNVDIDVSKAGAGGGQQSAIIRTGNSDNKSTYKQVIINLTDCTLDATGAVGRSGILIVDAKADVNLRSTTILTQKETYCAAIQGCQIYGSDVSQAAISMDGNCVLKTGGSTAYEDIIKNLDDSGSMDAHEYIIRKYDDFAQYKTEIGYTAPADVPSGYLFGGWYIDETCSAEYALQEGDSMPESAYAKFVPEHVLSVKAQISANLMNDDSTGDAKGAIRFVTTVDSLAYQEIGFEYTIKSAGRVIKEGKMSSAKVYRELYAIGGNSGEIVCYIPKYEFCKLSDCFKTFTITSIPKTLFEAEITVHPFWVTLDGTKVYGEEVTKTVQQGIDASKR